MTKVETGLKSIAIELGNMKNILKKIFIAVLRGGKINNTLATSIDNNNNTNF